MRALRCDLRWKAAGGLGLLDAAAKRGFRFGEIPTEASPEIVLTRLTALAAGTH